MKLCKQELDVGLVSANATTTADFYGNVMGFQVLPEVSLSGLGTRYRFKLGNHVIELNDLAAEVERDGGGVDKANGMRLLAFILDDLDAVLTQLDAAHLPYRRLPLPEEVPFQVAFSADPDGNALELVGLRQPAGDRFQARVQIGLTVSDVERTRRFYSGQLGFPPEPEMKLPASLGVEGNVRYGVTVGGTTVKFWKGADGLPTRTGAPELRTGIRLMTAFVEDLDAAHAQLAERGVEITTPPRDSQGSTRALRIADPDGNPIELVQASSALTRSS